MNRVILTGNIANEPESRTTQSGIAQCTFRLAVQRTFANQQGVREADFLTIVAWRQRAEFASRYFHKGSRILVEGSIQTRSYDAQDGSKRWVTEIIADNFEFAGGSRNDGDAAPRTESFAPAPHPAESAAAPDEMQEIDDDELPF